MKYSTSKTQEIFRNEFTGISGEPFSIKDFGKKGIDKTPISLDLIKKYKKACVLDITYYFYKALLSFAEGISSAKRGFYSWATVQLYYSVFYGTRCSLMSKRIIMLKANRILYYVDLMSRSAEYIRTKDTSDHGGTINTYINFFEATDFLCSNQIGGKNSYQWMKTCREIVNYKDVEFHEPEANYMWDKIDRSFRAGVAIEDLVDEYVNNKSRYCFSEDEAILAFPIHAILQVAQTVKNEGVFLDEEKIKVIQNLIGDLEQEFLSDIGVF